MVHASQRILSVTVFVWASASLLTSCGTGASAEEGPIIPGCKRIVLDGGGGILPPPDGASLCPDGPCNYQTQDGCPANQACRPQFSAASTDVAPGCEATGSGTAGDPCETWTDCARGYLCAVEERMGVTAGFCRKQCCGADWSACDEGESCIRQLEVRAGGVVTDTGAHLCFPVGTCHVLDPNSCADDPGRECKLVDPRGSEACSPISSDGLGDPCGAPNVCGQGLSCVDGACRRLCSTIECGEPSCPPAEGTCVHFDRNPDGVGECTPGW